MEFTSRQLRAFHFVAQHQSFARAAEKLFMTPSGVSVLIRELERQLGFRLFDRTTRQVELTAYGNELLAITQSSLKALDAAMSRIEQGRREGRVRSPLGQLRGWPRMFCRPRLRNFESTGQIYVFDSSTAI